MSTKNYKFVCLKQEKKEKKKKKKRKNGAPARHRAYVARLAGSWRRLFAAAASVPRGSRSTRSSTTPWPETTLWLALMSCTAPAWTPLLLLWIYSKKTKERNGKGNGNGRKKHKREKRQENGSDWICVAGRRRWQIIRPVGPTHVWSTVTSAACG